MKLEQLKEMYKDEWILTEVNKIDNDNNPIDLEILTHSKNREDTINAMKKYDNKYTYHFYNGEITNKNCVVVF